MNEKPSDTKDREPLETLVHVPGRAGRHGGQTAGLKSGHAGACRGADGPDEDSREAGGQCRLARASGHQGTCRPGPWVGSRVSLGDL